jgi:hypothetical protein
MKFTSILAILGIGKKNRVDLTLALETKPKS